MEMSNFKHGVLLLLSVALLLSLFMVFPKAFGQTVDEFGVVGVKPGDWVKYKVTQLGAPTIWYPGMEDAVLVKVEVLNVSGTRVTIQQTIHDADGSEFVGCYYSGSSWDLQNDILYGHLCAYRRYIIAANFEPGDKIGEYSVWYEDIREFVYVDLTLNDTDLRSYGEVEREVNRLEFTWLAYEYPFVRNDTLEKCWDKETGFLLEETRQSYVIGYENHPSTFKLEIADTNMWEMQKPQQLLWLLAAIPVGFIIVAIVAAKRKNNRKENTIGEA
ncbi:MAG: hypothetical protein OEY24_03825 [Candidatus Bathyarchaeota archaeon]|nr:hypothetical protein [Candidatus Bathyarchaeota archaeon]